MYYLEKLGTYLQSKLKLQWIQPASRKFSMEMTSKFGFSKTICDCVMDVYKLSLTRSSFYLKGKIITGLS